MPEKLINDNLMLKMVNSGTPQADIARNFGVSPSAINKRLRQLRGRTTYAVAAAKVEQLIDGKIDIVNQLNAINAKAHTLLGKVEDDPRLAVYLMAEIRNQLRLMMDVFETLYSLEGAAQFQQAVLETLEKCEPVLREEVIHRLNEQSSLRSALRFK